ncbi:DUF2817 domain-containing protein [Paraburkholderia sp. BCC1884]|uniref:DUF2817 domain-containing protein n=1 Tax=Paraburkholderia sp. BCC1884 TaxID=2562668 RepID=UPI001181D064|nr:DUF2817 domain-containing protein [Paraburkholderia sp. BCC1884]
MLIRYTDYFSASYQAARTKFRDAVNDAAGDFASYECPSGRGVEGEELAIDVGLVGNRHSPRQFVMISATHGLEGFAGAALQVAWLRNRIDPRLLGEIGIVLIHGLNPYGFSHGIRTTEDGVDLNRNFIDHTANAPDNELYRQIHPYLIADMADPAAWAQAQLALDHVRGTVGDDVLFDAIASGQYRHPDGIFYGGAARTWENRTLEEIVLLYAGRASKVAVIDWHTGIGAYGKPFFLAFADDESQEQMQAVKWWGQDNVVAARPHGRNRPRYKGLVFDGIRGFIPHAQVAGGVIEWGTRGPVAGEMAIRQDLWLRDYGHLLSSDAYAQMRADLLDSLNPVSYLWRNSVLSTGVEIMNATAQGLAAW